MRQHLHWGSFLSPHWQRHLCGPLECYKLFAVSFLIGWAVTTVVVSLPVDVMATLLVFHEAVLWWVPFCVCVAVPQWTPTALWPLDSSLGIAVVVLWTVTVSATLCSMWPSHTQSSDVAGCQGGNEIAHQPCQLRMLLGRRLFCVRTVRRLSFVTIVTCLLVHAAYSARRFWAREFS